MAVADGEENPMNMGNTVDAYREEMVNSLRGIVRIQSVREPALPGKPYGEGAYEALRYALELGASWGFATRNVGGHAGHVEFEASGEPMSDDCSGQAADAGNSACEASLAGEAALAGEDISRKDYVAVLAHLDVVPAGLGWTFPPYDGVMDGDRIYGRGASDDKGPAIVALYGLKALRDAGYRPKRSIRVILGCAEETGSEDMDHYFSKEPLPLMAFTPDVGYPAINREKGILRIRINKEDPGRDPGVGFIRRIQGGDTVNMVPRQCFATVDSALLTEEQGKWLKESAGAGGRVSVIRSEEEPGLLILETIGKSAHGAAPEMGINAVLLMVKWLEALCGIGTEGKARNNFLEYVNGALGAGTEGQGLGISCHDAESGALSMNVGSISMDAASLTLAIDIRYPITRNGEVIAEIIRRHAGGTNATVIVDRDVAPLHFPEDHPLIGRLSIAYEMHTGKKLELLSTGGGTYARSMAGRGIGFGGAGAGAHSPDEYVDVEDLMSHARICTQAMYEISK